MFNPNSTPHKSDLPEPRRTWWPSHCIRGRLTLDVKSQAPKSVTTNGTSSTGTQECAGCGKHITESARKRETTQFMSCWAAVISRVSGKSRAAVCRVIYQFYRHTVWSLYTIPITLYPSLLVVIIKAMVQGGEVIDNTGQAAVISRVSGKSRAAVCRVI
ncbi:hypothetical protein J6590_009737 [Homalodisca vitripennis]|nr:hypothetical protein J6590_009737 [Homalodisca vitripennis]